VPAQGLIEYKAKGLRLFFSYNFFYRLDTASNSVFSFTLPICMPAIYGKIKLHGFVTEQLKSEGVTIVDKIEDSEYGKFIHIIDVEGNKVELWEPKE
jgi:hypothetical protein